MNTRAVAATVPSLVEEVFAEVRRLTTRERLALARLLLDSVLAPEPGEETDWSCMSLEAFQEGWENAEDAVYDHWREHYGVPAR